MVCEDFPDVFEGPFCFPLESVLEGVVLVRLGDGVSSEFDGESSELGACVLVGEGDVASDEAAPY